MREIYACVKLLLSADKASRSINRIWLWLVSNLAESSDRCNYQIITKLCKDRSLTLPDRLLQRSQLIQWQNTSINKFLHSTTQRTCASHLVTQTSCSIASRSIILNVHHLCARFGWMTISELCVRLVIMVSFMPNSMKDPFNKNDRIRICMPLAKP